MAKRPATVRVEPEAPAKGARSRDIVCHVNVARGFRGGERQTELLIRGLAKWGVRQRLIARRDEPLADRFNDLPELDVRRSGGSALSVMRHASGAALLHVHEGRSVHSASLRHRFFRTPYVITRRVDNPIRRNAATRRAYRRAAAIVVLSAAIEKQVKRLDDALECRVIPSAASALTSFKASSERLRKNYEGKFLVGHVGALDHSHKGQLTILEIATELQRTHPHIQFVLLGSGKDEALFKERAAALGNVELRGYVDNVGDWLAAFDAFVFPSLHEGLGSVLLDAMDYALPIVATRVGGIPDLIRDGVNGLLVQPENPDQLRYALLRIVDDPALARRLGDAGRQRVQDFSPERMAERYLEVYQPLIGASRAATEIR